MVMKIAYELGKTEDEILSLTGEEYSRWVAFFKIKAEQEKAEAIRARRR